MVIADVARWLLERWIAPPDMHMGRFLHDVVGLQWQQHVGACYVWPPIGSFFTHTSQTRPGAVLRSHFSSKWAQEGTRKRTPAQLDRRLGEFTAFGPAVWLTEDIRLLEQLEELRWLTQAPPHTPPELLGWKPRHEGKTTESSMQMKLEVVLVSPLAPSASAYRSTGRWSMF